MKVDFSNFAVGSHTHCGATRLLLPETSITWTKGPGANAPTSTRSCRLEIGGLVDNHTTTGPAVCNRCRSSLAVAVLAQDFAERLAGLPLHLLQARHQKSGHLPHHLWDFVQSFGAGRRAVERGQFVQFGDG